MARKPSLQKKIEGIVEKYIPRKRKSLPKDWQKGRKCPECGCGAERYKCAFDMGGYCPRHNPDNYEPSPYVEVPNEKFTDLVGELVGMVENAD